MKKIKIAIMTLCLGLTSCADWLDVMPQTSIPEEELFSKEYGFKDALTGFYLMMGESSLYGRDLTYNYMDMLAGRYDNASGIYNWETVYAYDGQYESTKNSFFAGLYNIIANINNFLYYIDAKKDVIKTEHYYETMKGEALGLRAFLHFDLLRMFGPVYAQNPEGKSIPYRTKFDNQATPVLPASEVVDLCLKDLHEADSLLEDHDSEIFSNSTSADQFTIMRQYRMNKWAVKALMARIYLYKGDEESKALALKYAQEVVNSGHFLLYENNNDNKILFNEHIFSIYIYELDKIVDPDFVDASASMITSLSSTRFDQLFEKTGAGVTDFRCGNNGFTTVRDNSLEKKVLLKFNQNQYTDDYSGRGAMPLIRLPEMYYIMAECEPDPKLAAEYINTVRFARGIALSDAIDGNDDFFQPDTRYPEYGIHTVCVNEVMKEMQKEYYGEGQLFYFYKRHGYKAFFGSPSGIADMNTKYQMPLPDDEITFGK